MIYLCGMTCNEVENIRQLTDPVWEHIDGLIWVDHGSTDGTRELLEERKGQGEIISAKWTNNHDHSMNKWLLEGPLKEGDWFVIRDSMERFNPDYAKSLSGFLTSVQAQKIRSVFNYGKGFAFVKNDNMFFRGSPHWGLEGATSPAIELSDHFDEDKHEHTWRIRDGEEGGRPIDNKIDHEAKYSWVYGRSNHLFLHVGEVDGDELARAESLRNLIRDYAFTNGFDKTIQGLKDFMIFLRKEDVNNFAAWINSHKVWKNFYRYHFLEDKFEDIEATENVWNYTPVIV